MPAAASTFGPRGGEPAGVQLVVADIVVRPVATLDFHQ